MDINAVFTVVKQSETFDVSAFGILYPLSQKEYTWKNCVIKGLVAVAVIEGLQPIFGRAFDMNDIITPVNAPYEPTEPHPEPIPRKIRKSGTGCIYQINDHLWEGSFFPRLPNGKRKKFNVYAETKEQCEIKLAEMITQKKAEIAEEKAKLKEGAD